ncbi:iron-containing alcohol dehydrogenase [Paraburkholderia caribensis]|uniref:iron-containing alcohol dehydrogenase n=1 Tax=Paraburkholderia caribensis TaxID=75105 RepID=UPI0031DA75CA
MSQFTFETVSKIVCEQGGVQRLGELARSIGMTHAFLVTDQGLLKAGLVTDAVESLEGGGIKVTAFSDVLSDPPEASIQHAASAARVAGADGVIGFGGGSSLDTAKLVALLVRSSQSLPNVYGIDIAAGPRLPLIQIPTTAGTGSEVTPISIVTTPTLEKKGVVSPFLYPDIALLDSTLTVGLPPAVTAMTGVDAMVHAIEAYTTRLKKNPLSDALAIKALQLLYANLAKVIDNGDDLDAREAMLTGSLLAGMAFANAPVGAVHALAYPLGARYHLPHGLCNSLVLIPVLEFNRPVAEAQYAELGRAIRPELTDTSTALAARVFVDTMRDLVASMPFKQTLKEAGVDQTDLKSLATDAMNVQRLLVNNPRDLTVDDALSIYQVAF